MFNSRYDVIFTP